MLLNGNVIFGKTKKKFFFLQNIQIANENNSKQDELIKQTKNGLTDAHNLISNNFFLIQDNSNLIQNNKEDLKNDLSQLNGSVIETKSSVQDLKIDNDNIKMNLNVAQKVNIVLGWFKNAPST